MNKNYTSHVKAIPLHNVIDTTGAGDAFLGGIIAGIHCYGLPDTEDELRVLGEVGNAAGAACCSVLGALPSKESRLLLRELLAEQQHPMLDIIQVETKDEGGKGAEKSLHDDKIVAFNTSLDNDAKAAKSAANSLNSETNTNINTESLQHNTRSTTLHHRTIIFPL